MPTLPDLPLPTEQQAQLPDLERRKSALDRLGDVAQEMVIDPVEHGIVQPALGMTRGLEQSLLNLGFGALGRTAPRVTRDTFADKIGKGIGDVAQFAYLGPEKLGMGGLGLAGRMAAGGGIGGILSTVQGRGEGHRGTELLKDWILGTGFGALGEGTGAALKAVEEAYPTRLRRDAARPGSELATPEETQEFLSELERRGIDVPLDLASVAQDPSGIEFYHRFLSRYAPGVKANLQRRAEAYNVLFEDKYRALQGGRTAEESRNMFQKGLERHYDDESTLSKQYYSEYADAANKLNVPMKEIPNSERIFEKYEDLELPGTLKTLRDRLREGGLSFTDIDKEVKKLGRKINWGIKGDPVNNFKKELSHSLKNDMSHNVDLAGVPELTALRDRATNHYRDNLGILHEEPALYRLAKTSKWDLKDLDSVLQNRDMANIIAKLPDEEKKAGLYYLYSKSVKNEAAPGEKAYKKIQPYTLLRLHKNMPQELKKVFFSPTDEAAMKFYEHMAAINASSKAELTSLRTGEQAAKHLADLTKLHAVEKLAESPTQRNIMGFVAGKTGLRYLPAYLRSDAAKQAFITGKSPALYPRRIGRGAAATGMVPLRELLGDDEE